MYEISAEYRSVATGDGCPGIGVGIQRFSTKG